MRTYNVMRDFRKEFRICDISLSLIEKFDDHMQEVNGISSGGRNLKHKNFRTVILDIQKHNIPYFSISVFMRQRCIRRLHFSDLCRNFGQRKLH